MNIHEYQSKAILKNFGAPVSKGQPALTVNEAVAAAKIARHVHAYRRRRLLHAMLRPARAC
jgi:succinyl-CoA synthetase beta subunit